MANIGFHAAALSHDGHTVPAYLISLGGQTDPGSAQIAQLVGKFPARNCTQVIKTLLRLYRDEKNAEESFNDLSSVSVKGESKTYWSLGGRVPEFADDSSFYDDYGHENERFAIRHRSKG